MAMSKVPPTLFQNRLPCVSIAPFGRPVDEVAADQLLAHAADNRAQRGIGNQRVNAGVVDDERKLGPGQAKIDRHEDRAQRPCSEHRLEKVRVIDADVANPIAAANTQRL